MSIRQKLPATRRWVVKIGSALLTDNGKGLDVEAIADWVKQLADLRHSGVEVLLVSSGAVAAGMTRLGWTQDLKQSTNCRLQLRWGKPVWCRPTNRNFSSMVW